MSRSLAARSQHDETCPDVLGLLNDFLGGSAASAHQDRHRCRRVGCELAKDRQRVCSLRLRFFFRARPDGTCENMQEADFSPNGVSQPNGIRQSLH